MYLLFLFLCDFVYRCCLVFHFLEDHNGNKYLYFLCYPPQYLYILLCIFMFLLRNKSIQYKIFLYDCMLSHGCVPNDILISRWFLYSKNNRKSLNDSANYRAIALSSILEKLLDNILLDKCSRVFQTSDLQYGFKQKHSLISVHLS